MAIPNVIMKWCQKKAECQWCNQDIEVGSAMVAVFFWNKGDDGRRWNVQKCYHPNCWVAQGMDYLERNPYVPYIRGRRKSSLSPEDSRQRYLIIRRYHALNQRIGKLGNGADLFERLELEMHQIELILEMQKLGGVPKKWLEKL